MLDFPIVDSHVHLLDPGRFGYAWTKGAPSLNRLVLPADLTAAAAPVKIDRFVFVEVDVDFPQHLDEAALGGRARQDRAAPQGHGRRAAAREGQGDRGEVEELRRRNPVVRGVRRLIQNQPDPDFCIRPDFIAGLKLLAPHDFAFDICVFHHQLPNAIKMVRQCPEVRFVLDHIGKPAIKAGLDRSLAAADERARRLSQRLSARSRVSPPRPTTRTGRASSSGPISPTPSMPSASTAAMYRRRLACPRARWHLSRLGRHRRLGHRGRERRRRERKLFRDNAIGSIAST